MESGGIARQGAASARYALVVVAVALLGAFAAAALARSPSVQVLRSIERQLCSFPLAIEVTRTFQSRRSGATTIRTLGPTAVELRNVRTDRTATLRAAGPSSQEAPGGSLQFSGHQLWLSAKNHVPYLSTHGRGSRLAPEFVLGGGALRRVVVDPCALVAESPPSTGPVTTPAPWPVPAYALSRFAYAGLTPLIGKPTRHDHLHLDVLVNGRKIDIPAGIGQAAPLDVGPGPCPPPPEHLTIGDCAPRHYFVAKVAAAELQTHSTSGIVHIQSERRARFTLGHFFDVWGVRLDASCVGGYCTGDGKELRVYVDGKRLAGNPRKVVLLHGRQIAVVYGRRSSFRSVPATYKLRMPHGCGGPRERPCRH